MPSNPLIQIAECKPHRLGTVKNVSLAWPDLAGRLLEFEVTPESFAEYMAMDRLAQGAIKDVGSFVGGAFSGTERRADQLLNRTLVVLDVDGPDLSAAKVEARISSRFMDLDFVAHSTHKHCDEKPRLRVVLPTNRPMTVAEYPAVARRIAQMLDKTLTWVDPASFKANQVMFWPSRSVDGDELALSNDWGGDPVDVDEVLATYANWKNRAEWPRRAGDDDDLRESADKREDPRTKVEPIGAFCRLYDIHRAVTELIPGVYEWHDDQDRYRFIEGEGAPGARLYYEQPNFAAYLHSQHTTDPACGQHNAWDLVRIHKGLNQHQMMDFANSLPDVAAEALRQAQAEFTKVDAAASTDADSAKHELFNTVMAAAGAVRDLVEYQGLVEKVRRLPFEALSASQIDVVTDTVHAQYGKAAGVRVSSIRDDLFRRKSVADIKGERSEQDGPDWLAPWVYVAQEDRFFDTKVRTKALSRDSFNGTFGRDSVREFGATDRGTALVKPSEVALEIHPVPVVASTMYWPGEAGVFKHDGQDFANTYRDTGAKPATWKGSRAVKLMLMHLDNLFPDQDQRDILLDFFSHIVRFPDRKLMYAMLVRGGETDGKSYFAELMKRVLGVDNWTTINNDQIKEHFSGWLEGKLLVCVEEVKQHGQDAHDVLNRMKPFITNETVGTRAMRQDVRSVRNFANFYMTTNYADAMPLQDTDSRYCVLSTRFSNKIEVEQWCAEFRAKQGFDFYPELWDSMRAEAGALRQYLMDRPFSALYQPDRRAPETTFKRVMAHASRTEEDVSLEEVIADEGVPTVNRDFIVWPDFVRACDEAGNPVGPALRGRGVASFLGKHGYMSADKCRIGPRTVGVWVRKMDWVDHNTGRLTDVARGLVQIQAHAALSAEFRTDAGGLLN